MIRLDILEDEGLQLAINKFASALLPHDEYDDSFYLNNLNTVFKYVALEEMTMEYKMLFTALYEFGRLKVNFETYTPMLKKEVFDQLVEASVMDSVMKPDIGIKSILQQMGMDTDLNNEKTREDACQLLWQRCMDLYDACMELEIPSSEAMNYEPELKEAFKAAVSQQSINTQAEIIRGEVRIGRRHFRGVDGWIDYSASMLAEVRSRLVSSADSKTIVVNSMEVAIDLISKAKNYYERVADWGIPELDDFTPMLTHTYGVIVGKENIGKTKFAINSAANALLADKKVVYMCGETSQEEVYVNILICYIYKKYGVKLRPVDIHNMDETPDEIHRLIGITLDTLVTGGKLTMQDSFDYGTCYEEMCAVYESNKFDVLLIDHSCALKGTTGDGSWKAKVDKLSQDVMAFRRAYPVFIGVLSHPSSDEKEDARKGKDTSGSPTKYSQDLSVNADFVYILRENETLIKQGLLALTTYKRRFAAKLIHPVYLRKEFDVAAIVYDEELQAPDADLTNKQLQAIRELDEDLADVEDGLLH